MSKGKEMTAQEIAQQVWNSIVCEDSCFRSKDEIQHAIESHKDQAIKKERERIEAGMDELIKILVDRRDYTKKLGEDNKMESFEFEACGMHEAINLLNGEVSKLINKDHE